MSLNINKLYINSIGDFPGKLKLKVPKLNMTSEFLDKDYVAPQRSDEISSIINKLKHGVSTQNLFLVEFEHGEEVFSFLCTGASIPFFKPKEGKIFQNHLERKFVTGLDLDSVDLSFYIDKQSGDRSNILNFLVGWNESIYYNEKDEKPNNRFIRYKNTYTKKTAISLVDENLKKYFTCELSNSYPSRLSNIDLSTESSVPIKITLTLNFDDVEYYFSPLPEQKSFSPAPSEGKGWSDTISSIKGTVNEVENMVGTVKGLKTSLKNTKNIKTLAKNKITAPFKNLI